MPDVAPPESPEKSGSSDDPTATSASDDGTGRSEEQTPPPFDASPPTTSDDFDDRDETADAESIEGSQQPSTGIDKDQIEHPKLTREQAKELAEAERAELEANLQQEQLELARADAERLLAGPGLITPDPPLTPGDLESAWGARAQEAISALRHDLDGHRVGLAISGGGSLGSFEVGALRFLYDHTDIQPVAICGNSAGALNAAKLAEGRQPHHRAIDEAERLWRSLRINHDMWEPEPWLVRLQASASWANDLREQVSDSDGAAAMVRVAVKVAGSLVRRPPETDGTIEAIRESVRAKSLLSFDPIAALVSRELNPELVAASGIALRMGTVSLEAGELRYVTETGALHDRHDQPIGQDRVDLTSGVIASASIPMAFPPVEMNGEHYVDGGAREILPLELLVTHLGVDRVIAISAGSASIKRRESFADRNLLDILRRVSAEIAPNETLRKELNPPGGWNPDVRLVVPRFDVHDSMTIDPALIAISIDHGYMRSADVLLDLGEEAFDMADEITRIRIELRHLAGPVATLFDSFHQARVDIDKERKDKERRERKHKDREKDREKAWEREREKGKEGDHEAEAAEEAEPDESEAARALIDAEARAVELEKVRRAQTLTSSLAKLVRRRHDEGYPVPQTLTAWLRGLDTTADAETLWDQAITELVTAKSATADE